MDYALENLSPERFQQLCQSLLVHEFPDVQCFPVAQPDGGRDAISFRERQITADIGFNVYQVKFARKPLAETDPHKWLVDVLTEEIPKVKELIPRGAKAYYLLTNVPGTAHLETGSIDRADALLRTLGIPSHCWWRDDLSRRLDGLWDLKWAYPEIMNGPDVLRLIVEQGLTTDKERRANAIRTFVRSQYLQDEDVRFKQVELQNKLLDLFVDVPLAEPSHGDRRAHFVWRQLVERPRRGEDRAVGAATFFLNRAVQEFFPYAVLQGAPGQGKSTLAQYICQVYRMRLLGETEPFSRIPEHHRPTALRLPIRVDLRDLATWLSREDPFSAEEHAAVPLDWARSLESFLVALIRHESGGAGFSVDDLHAVSKVSSLLLVLDGLDEVADIPKRKDVVAAVKLGVSRLAESSASLQVIITSRPAAFANSPGFPPRSFPHFQLGSLTRQLITDYADQWLIARRVQGREASNAKKILRFKVQQPQFDGACTESDAARHPT